ncbi:MAG: hypothetical protein CME32_08430 [Gimesia sp.]|nr:hypothetical protein [Gimesia sp.]
MKSQQERLARELFHKLSRSLQNRQPPVELSLEQVDEHWICHTKRNNSACSIDVNDLLFPEQHITFCRDEINWVTGRIPVRNDLVTAVGDWLAGRSVSEMYEHFQFVERKKRELLFVRARLLQAIPDLEQTTTIQLEPEIGDFCRLHLRGKDRSAEIFFIGKGESPDVFFAWDDCELFRFKVKDQQQLAQVMKRWICERCMPSTLQEEFPWIELHELAEYYEKGNPIEGEFLVSWESVEDFYDEIIRSMEHRHKIRAFMDSLRSEGYDKTLRAGHSMATFVLSRSRRHGIDEHQPALGFHFNENSVIVYNYLNRDHFTEEEYPGVELNPDIDALLQQLVAMPIT